MSNAQSIKASSTLTINGASHYTVKTLEHEGNIFEVDQEILHSVATTWEAKRNGALIGEYTTQKELVALLRGGMACRHEDAPSLARKLWTMKIRTVNVVPAAKAA